MSSLIATFLLGLTAAIFASYLQHRSWRHRNYEETLAREFKDASAIIESLSVSIDRRLEAQSRMANAVSRNEVTDDILSSYSQSIENWMQNFSSLKSKIYLFFGYSYVLHFENEVHASLRATSDIIRRSYRYGAAGKNLSPRHQREFASINHKLASARIQAYEFLKEINRLVLERKFGSVQHFDDVNSPDLKKVSRTYLLRRLFGMKS